MVGLAVVRQVGEDRVGPDADKSALGNGKGEDEFGELLADGDDTELCASMDVDEVKDGLAGDEGLKGLLTGVVGRNSQACLSTRLVLWSMQYLHSLSGGHQDRRWPLLGVVGLGVPEEVDDEDEVFGE